MSAILTETDLAAWCKHRRARILLTTTTTTTTTTQRCSLETLVLVSRRLEDMKNGLGLDDKVSTFSRPL